MFQQIQRATGCHARPLQEKRHAAREPVDAEVKCKSFSAPRTLTKSDEVVLRQFMAHVSPAMRNAASEDAVCGVRVEGPACFGEQAGQTTAMYGAFHRLESLFVGKPCINTPPESLSARRPPPWPCQRETAWLAEA